MTSRSCIKCKQLCDKPLQLPECGHVFCKRCSADYFGTLSSWMDEPDYVSCPECGKKVGKPNFTTGKWTKAFKINKTSTFFTQNSDELLEHGVPENGSDFGQSYQSTTKASASRKLKESKFYTNDSHGQSQQELDTGSYLVKLRGTSLGKSRSRHRTVMKSSDCSIEKGFESKTSSDKNECLYFGGDTMPNGDIILCDWLNFSVKMFDPSGQFICQIKLEEAPLDVTAARSDIIVVSFGSRSKIVLFLTYVESRKDLEILGGNKLPGYLYNTTQYEGNCLGIFERDGKKKASVVQIAVDKPVGKSSVPRRTVSDFITSDKCVELTSESGIFYDHRDRRLYVTSRRKLMCFGKDRRLIFSKSFTRTSSELYILGSVTCDEKGVVYVASDLCILQVTEDGDLISVVHTPAEPYHIILTKDQRKLAVVGKQNDVMYYTIETSPDYTDT